jgi:hypothetical protein
VFTYADQVHFSITSCPEMVAEPAEMARHFEIAFASLKSAASAAASG